MGTLRFQEIVDLAQIQRLMHLHYEAAGVPASLLDSDGFVLAAAGWHPICQQFHQAYPESRAMCEQSHQEVTRLAAAGEVQMYRCRNGMWNIVVPVMVSGQHLATFNAGQFFLVGEEPEGDRFRAQAGRFGYNLDAYLEAYRNVPFLTQQRVQMTADFHQALVGILGELGLKNQRVGEQAQALRRSEEKYRALVEGSRDIIIRFDPKGRPVYMNKGTEAITGAPLPVVSGKSLEALGFPADLSTFLRDAIKEVVRSGRPHRERFEMDGGSGRQVLDWQATPEMDDHGQVISVISTARDMTEEVTADQQRRNSQRLLEKTLASLRDAVFIVDANHDPVVVVDCNPAALEMFGYSREEIIGKPGSFAHVSDQAYAQFMQHLRLATERYGYLDRYEFLMKRKDGSVFPSERSVLPLEDEQGKRVGWVSVVRDITERKRAEEELLKAEKLESIGLLAGGIAHDFNNLLTAILGNLSLARGLVTDSEIRQMLGQAEKASLRAQDLTQQLLTFARGGVPLKRLTSVADLVAEVSCFALRGSRTRCTLRIQPDLWPATVDPGQISQVINNLLINADQAMPAGGTVTVSLENSVVKHEHGLPILDGEYVCLRVKDEGLGIPREHLRKIFDPYFTTKQKGSGLGLATSYSIVRNHAGHIRVDSELGIGTTFDVFLPASRGDDVQTPTSIPLKMASGYRILVMDDEPAVCDVAGRMLSHLGCKVTCVNDGAEAIEAYCAAREAGHPFHVVIMDLTIPGGMGGMEAIARLRQIDPYVRAIVSSGYSTSTIMSEYRKHGFCAVMAKPYDVHQLGQTIQEVMQESL